MTLDREQVQQFATALRERGKQPATIESYSRDAARFLDYLESLSLPVSQVEPDTLVAYQKHLREEAGERDNSVRRTVIGVRQYFRYLTEVGVISTTPFDSVAIPVRDETLPEGLSHQGVESLIDIAASGRHPIKTSRDVSLVALLAFEGLKANEVINLTWTDFIDAGNRGTLNITGNRSRAIALSDESYAYMKAYKEACSSVVHPAAPGEPQHIFTAFKGRDAATPIPVMTRHGLKFILYELGEKAGLSRLNTEQLRHFAVTYLISIGRTSEEIMLHLGLKRLGNISKHLARAKKQDAAIETGVN